MPPRSRFPLCFFIQTRIVSLSIVQRRSPGSSGAISRPHNHTRFMRITLPPTKDEALEAYKTFASWVEK